MITIGNEENASQELLQSISDHTDAWGGWMTTPLTILTIFASIATICGLIMIYIEMRRQKASLGRQELIVKDLIRHLFINAAIMEVIRMKMTGKWAQLHPTEGVFTRFCVLDSDLELSQISVTDEQYTKLHRMSLFLRNYNIMSLLAEKHFNDPDFDPKEKELELDELWRRTVTITKEFLRLGDVTKLDITKESVRDFVLVHYPGKNDSSPSKNDLPERKGDRAYYDNDLNLREVFDDCIIDKYDNIRVIPFA